VFFVFYSCSPQALQYKPKGRRNRGRPRKRRRDKFQCEDQGTGNTPNPSWTWWRWWWFLFSILCILWFFIVFFIVMCTVSPCVLSLSYGGNPFSANKYPIFWYIYKLQLGCHPTNTQQNPEPWQTTEYSLQVAAIFTLPINKSSTDKWLTRKSTIWSFSSAEKPSPTRQGYELECSEI
jgi:hypothetical protein